MTYDGPDRRNGRATLDSLSFQMGRLEGRQDATLKGQDRCEKKIDKVDGRVLENSKAIAGLEATARKSGRKSGGFWGAFTAAVIAGGIAIFKMLRGG